MPEIGDWMDLDGRFWMAADDSRWQKRELEVGPSHKIANVSLSSAFLSLPPSLSDKHEKHQNCKRAAKTRSVFAQVSFSVIQGC